MHANRQTHRQLSWQNWSFVLLFLGAIGLLAWLSTRYSFQADLTAAKRHTLSEASIQVLDKLEGPVTILAFARDAQASQSHARIEALLERYRHHKADLTFQFVNPDVSVDKVREYGISREGELVIEYQGRKENLTTLGEQALTNTLQRMLRAGERHVLFLSGHGERRFDGQANHDLGQFTQALQGKGVKFGSLNLSASPAIPADTAVLVIATPQVKLLDGEVKLITDYINNGGNLLWLSDPDETEGLGPIADVLGLKFDPGVVVDDSGRLLGIDHPAYILVTDYPEHPVTKGLDSITLFPIVRALSPVNESTSSWAYTRLLTTLPRAWSERGPLEGVIAFDPKQDQAGPLTIGYLLNRPRPVSGDDKGGDASKPMQRVAVIGDGDFLSNSYLGNGLNQELGERLINWLGQDDDFITIPPRTAPDTQLELTEYHSVAIVSLFLVLLPIGLLAAGITIWMRRRKS